MCPSPAAFYEDIALDDEDYALVKGLLLGQNASLDFELQVEDPGIHTRGLHHQRRQHRAQRKPPQSMYRPQTLKDKHMLRKILQEKKRELKEKCTGK